MIRVASIAVFFLILFFIWDSSMGSFVDSGKFDEKKQKNSSLHGSRRFSLYS